MPRILITGSSGRLGNELKGLFKEALTPSHSELDLTDSRKVCNYIFLHRPEIIIHLAALTDVVKCEFEKKLAYDMNVKTTINLIRATRFLSPYFIYMSTPCVFKGDNAPYFEDDAPDPVNYYGLTKWMGEIACQTLSTSLIIRAGFTVRNFWPYKQAFTDRYLSHLYSDELALKIRDLVFQRRFGIIHIVGEDISLYDLAKRVNPDIEPISLNDFKLPVHLTRDMRLRTRFA